MLLIIVFLLRTLILLSVFFFVAVVFIGLYLLKSDYEVERIKDERFYKEHK